MIDQMQAWLELNLQNQYWRIGLIVGVALVLALVARIVLVPILNRLTRRTATNIDEHILALVWPAVFRTIILQGVHIATLDLVSDLAIDHIVVAITSSLMVLIWGRLAGGVGTVVFRKLSENAERFAWIQPQTLPLIQFVYKVAVFSLMSYLILASWHVNLTSWLASAGVAGIALGFAAKDTLANFISGIFILADAPYRVGQYIIIDGTTRGVVTEIGMRSTRLLTRDNVEVTVPNAVIGNAKIVNESSGPSPRMRVRVQVGVAYGSDVDLVKEVLMTCAREVGHTAEAQDPSVHFKAMGESSLDFQVLVWVKHPAFRGRVVDDLNMRIYKALAEVGVEIPFPQRDLHIKSWPEGGAGLTPAE